MDALKYRPRGSERSKFRREWCDKCEGDREYRETEWNSCKILVYTMCYDAEDEEYPKEWTYAKGAPCCTAFIPEGEAVPEVDDNTSDMFTVYIGERGY